MNFSTRMLVTFMAIFLVMVHVAQAGTSKPDCNPAGQNFKEVMCEDIREGIKYLRGIPNGVCDSPARSSSNGCTRVSCSYHSAIFVCNDNDYHIWPSCNEVADVTQDIINTCHTGSFDNPLTTPYCRGQEFHWGPDGGSQYNVVVRHDNSKCQKIL